VPRLRAPLLLALAVAALACGSANAHVVPSPAFVEAGGVSTIELVGPNERDVAMSGFAVTAPEGVRIVGAEPTGSWRVTERSSSAAAWAGGSLSPNDEVAFRIEVEARVAPGPIVLEAEQRYSGGEVVRWEVPLTVVPGPASPEENLSRALAVGLIGVAVIAGVGLVAWRRRVRAVPGDET
jgi:hypothetical protein